MTGDDQKRTLWDGSLPFRGEIRRLGSLLPSRSREGPDYVPLSQHSPLKGRGLNGSSPPPKPTSNAAQKKRAGRSPVRPFLSLAVSATGNGCDRPSPPGR